MERIKEMAESKLIEALYLEEGLYINPESVQSSIAHIVTELYQITTWFMLNNSITIKATAVYDEQRDIIDIDRSQIVLNDRVLGTLNTKITRDLIRDL